MFRSSGAALVACGTVPSATVGSGSETGSGSASSSAGEGETTATDAAPTGGEASGDETSGDETSGDEPCVVPQAGTTIELPPMFTGRASHGVAEIGDGDVLVIGGRACEANGRGELLASVERFQRATQMWVQDSSLPTGLAHHATLRLDESRAMVIGGETIDGASDAVLGYDAASASWSIAGELPEPTAAPASTRLAGSELFVLAPGFPLAANVYLSVDQGATWFSGAPASEIGNEVTLVALLDGRVVVVSSDDTAGLWQVYDPVSDSWDEPFDSGADLDWVGAAGVVGGTTVAALREAPAEGELTACLVPTAIDLRTGRWETACCSSETHGAGNLTDVRGFGGSGAYAVIAALGEAFVYDEITGWGQLPAALPPFAAATVLADGTMMITGGEYYMDGCRWAATARSWTR